MNSDRSESLLIGLPIWARVTALVGIPGIISIYLVYILTASVSADSRATRADVEMLTTTTSRHFVETREHLDALRSTLWVICRSVAKDATDRGDCRR